MSLREKEIEQLLLDEILNNTKTGNIVLGAIIAFMLKNGKKSKFLFSHVFFFVFYYFYQC
jgi:hypothetical protein